MKTKKYLVYESVNQSSSAPSKNKSELYYSYRYIAAASEVSMSLFVTNFSIFWLVCWVYDGHRTIYMMCVLNDVSSRCMTTSTTMLGKILNRKRK